MRNKSKSMVALLIVTGGILFTCEGCSINQKASGTVKTVNTVDAKITVNFPICDRADWTFEQVTRCIDLCNEYEVKVSTDENFGKVLEVLNASSSQAEEAITPTLIQGVI